MSPWTTADEIRLAIKMGLKKGLRLVRGMRRAMTDDEQNSVASAIAAHLRLSNYKIEQGPPLGGHGNNIIPKRMEPSSKDKLPDDDRV